MIFFFEYNATKVWFTSTEIYVQLADGKTASLPIVNYPLLQNATQTQRQDFEIINGYAIYWQHLGEDLSVAGFFENKSITAICQ